LCLPGAEKEIKEEGETLTAGSHFSGSSHPCAAHEQAKAWWLKTTADNNSSIQLHKFSGL
jgi:hypothetical protein